MHRLVPASHAWWGMASHFFDSDGLHGADHHACFAFGAISRSGHPETFGITVEHVLRAYFETFTVVLALTRVYIREVHAKPLVSPKAKKVLSIEDEKLSAEVLGAIVKPVYHTPDSPARFVRKGT